jgi:hypothetical protein
MELQGQDKAGTWFNKPRRNNLRNFFLICKFWSQEEGEGEIKTSDLFIMRGPQPIVLPLGV